MRVKFYAGRGANLDIKHQAFAISSALVESTKNFGDDFEVVHNALFDGVEEDVDIACLWGVMGNAPSIVSQYVEHGKHVVMFDKALIRHLGEGGHGTFRVGIDGPTPVKYIMRVLRNFERWEKRRIDIKPRQNLGPLRGKNLYCGSSQKYCDYYNLGDANDYAENIINQVRNVKKKGEMVYRPKPSWGGAREIDGTVMSTSARSLARELREADILITHGSASAVEAIVNGVPAITLGPCAAQFVSGTTITNESILNPFFPSEEARWHWLCNLAYCQWNVDELRSGEAWGFIRNEILELDR